MSEPAVDGRARPTAAVVALLAVQGVVVLTLLLFDRIAPLAIPSVWHIALTGVGWVVLTLVVVVLSATAAVALYRRPDTLLACLAIAGTSLIGGAFVFFPWGLVALGSAIGALTTGALLGSRRTALPLPQAVVLVIVLATMLMLVWVVAGAAVSGLDQLSASFGVRDVVARVPSPSGDWTLVEIESDQGALGGSVDVFVERDLAGIVRLRRYVSWGPWDSHPTLRWVDDHRLSVDGRQVDLWRDPPIDVAPD